MTLGEFDDLDMTYENAQLAELHRDALLWRQHSQALADVRTLDEWAAKHSCDPFKTHPFQAGTEWHCVSAYECKRFQASTPDEARAKAAAWVRGLK